MLRNTPEAKKEVLGKKFSMNIEGVGNIEGIITNSNFLDSRSGAANILAFSATGQNVQYELSDVSKQQASHELINLLTAVAHGDEGSVKKIITSNPELLLNSSATVTDLSGKKIESLNSVEVAICACDVDMLWMMKQVLPELDLCRQFMNIYPGGDIRSVEKAQEARAEEIKSSLLNDIFTAINIATPAEVRAELDNPGVINEASPLNAALHKFRKQFSETSNQDLIFNPFYMLSAFEFYNEKVGKVNGNLQDQWNKVDLLWRQVIGFVQRHLPACYLQAFAQGVYKIAYDGDKLQRKFEFLDDDKKFSMNSAAGEPFKGLGFDFGALAGMGRRAGLRRDGLGDDRAVFEQLLLTKKSGLENLFTRRTAYYFDSFYQPSRCVIA